MSKEFKIGLFAVITAVVSFFLINYLRGEDIFNREIELSSRYQNVEGLVPSVQMKPPHLGASEKNPVSWCVS